MELDLVAVWDKGVLDQREMNGPDGFTIPAAYELADAAGYDWRRKDPGSVQAVAVRVALRAVYDAGVSYEKKRPR